MAPDPSPEEGQEPLEDKAPAAGQMWCAGSERGGHRRLHRMGTSSVLFFWKPGQERNWKLVGSATLFASFAGPPNSPRRALQGALVQIQRHRRLRGALQG